MKKFWTQAALGAATLLCVSAAHAYVIDFETVDTTFAPSAPLMADGDAVTQGNYFINTQDANAGGGLIAQLSLGSDSTSCLNGTCPSGDSSNFLSVYNDGLAHVGALSANTYTAFSSVDAAYISTPGNAPGSTVYFVIEADRTDATNSFAAFYYPLSSDGSFQTITASTPGTRLGGTGTLTSGNVTDLFFYTYFCDAATGSCTAFHTNKAQFAIDNITLDVPAVPEPAEWMLMIAGLTAVGAVARRRRAA